MDTATSEVCEELSYPAGNFRFIDKAAQLEIMADEAKQINKRVNDYLLANTKECTRLKLLHAAMIVAGGIRDLNVDGIESIPGMSISSSLPLFNKLSVQPSMESLSEFIESLHLDIDAMYDLVKKNNEVSL